MSKIKVITMATQKGGFMTNLLQSCNRHDLDLTILGWGEPWTCHMMKLRLMEDLFHKARFHPSDLVVWVDAFDCVFQSGAKEIIEAFRSYEKPLLFSSEQNGGWPLPAWVFPEGKFDYRGICAGVWMGEVWAIRQMLDTFDAHSLPDEYPGDDQGLIQAYAFVKPSLCSIDTMCRLALTLDLNEAQNPHEYVGNKYKNTLTGTIPCVLHGAAKYDMSKILEVIET